jgi:hypothetical protein
VAAGYTLATITPDDINKIKNNPYETYNGKTYIHLVQSIIDSYDGPKVVWFNHGAQYAAETGYPQHEMITVDRVIAEFLKDNIYYEKDAAPDAIERNRIKEDQNKQQIE